MKKVLSGLLAFSMLATSAVSFAAPAEARDRNHYRDRDRGHHQYYDRNHYNRGYYDDRRHRRHRGNGDAIAAGIVGLALGAIIVGSANDRRGLSHVERCERRYRSYDRRTDTFIGRDGREYYCNL